MLKQYFYNRTKKFQSITVVLAILIVAGIGTYLLTTSHAASPYVSLNASQGGLSASCASVKSSSSTSNGQYVQFDAPNCNSGGGGTTSFGKLIVSINNATGYGNGANEPVTLFKGIGVTWTRVFTDQIAQTVAEGMHPLPTYEPSDEKDSDGNCLGVSPAQVESDVAGLVTTLEQNKVPYLEICNESYLTENATTYAAQYDAAHKALAGTGIKALAVATALATGCSSGGTTSPDWIPTVIKDLPGGAAEVDAWTIHPYGMISGTPTSGCGTGTNGYAWADVPAWHTIAVNAGSNAPWFITEVGQCLGNNNGSGNCSGPVSQATQAADMTTYLTDTLNNYPWVVYINWYASCDDSSGDYGIIAREGSDNGVCDAGIRPAFTSMQTFVSQNAGKLGD